METQTLGQKSDTSTTIDADSRTHTSEQMDSVREYIGAVDKKVKAFFEKYKTNPKEKFERLNISEVSERQASDVSQLLVGEYSGYTNAIDRNGVLHIIKRHEEKGAADRSMADLNDAARIGYVLDFYDTFERVYNSDGTPAVSTAYVGRDNSPSPMIKFGKKINGSYYVVEAVPDSRYKKMWVVSAYIAKNNGDSYASAIDAEAPSITPEAPLASPVPVNNIITRDAEIINNPQKIGANGPGTLRQSV